MFITLYIYTQFAINLFIDSTNTELFGLPMGVLVDNIYGNMQTTIALPGGLTASSPIQPLQMNMLDSLTVHAKMRYFRLLLIYI